MSDLMDNAVINMPYELAMSDELSRKQFYSRAQAVLKERDEALAKLAAIESQPPVGKVCKGASYIDSDFTASAKQSLQDGQKLYAKPVPVDKPAVAVAYTNQSGHLCGTGKTIPPNTLLYMSTPSHSQQSARRVLNDDTCFILGRPNFWCSSIAVRMRELGHEIPHKSEDEQAHVINLMLDHYERFGGEWRANLENYLRSKTVDRCPSHESEQGEDHE